MAKWKSNGNYFYIQTSDGDDINIYKQGLWRHYNNTQDICNACLFDTVSKEYKLGYLLRTTIDGTVTNLKFFHHKKKIRLRTKMDSFIHNWCILDEVKD